MSDMRVYSGQQTPSVDIQMQDIKMEAEIIVEPVKLDATHPLYGIGGATNAVTYSTDLLGDITLIGPGAGRIETGYAIIGDILSFTR